MNKNTQYSSILTGLYNRYLINGARRFTGNYSSIYYTGMKLVSIMDIIRKAVTVFELRQIIASMLIYVTPMFMHLKLSRVLFSLTEKKISNNS